MSSPAFVHYPMNIIAIFGKIFTKQLKLKTFSSFNSLQDGGFVKINTLNFIQHIYLFPKLFYEIIHIERNFLDISNYELCQIKKC